MILDTLRVAPPDLLRRTGWEIKPEGACKGGHCVPLPETAVADGLVDVEVLAERLGMPLVRDSVHGLVALGPETGPTGRALTTARAPDLELPDRHGNAFRLSSMLGKKVVLVAWASW